MNRSQRRQLINNNNINSVVTPQQLNEQFRNKLRGAINDYSAVVALCLRDKLGFGNKRSKKFLIDIMTMFQDVNAGYLSIEDIKATLHEEINLMIG